MKKRLLALLCLLALCALTVCGCGGKKEEPVQETSLPAEPESETEADYQKRDVTMELARDDSLRAFLYAFDPYTDGGRPGEMEFDYRDKIGAREVMDGLYGQRCCADYSLYPVVQPTVEGGVQKVPFESFSWVAEHIFHVPVDEIEEYKSSCKAFSDDVFRGKTETNINGVQWYYSDFTILRAEEDGTYFYVNYRRNHDDPSVDGAKYQQEYYAILKKDKVADSEYWTMLTHSSSGFNYVEPDEEVKPDVVFETEKEMYVNADTPVTMRMGPSTEYGAISSYNPGIPMMAVGTKGDWVYVHYFDHYGWIHADLLSEEKK